MYVEKSNETYLFVTLNEFERIMRERSHYSSVDTIFDGIFEKTKTMQSFS